MTATTTFEITVANAIEACAALPPVERERELRRWVERLRDATHAASTARAAAVAEIVEQEGSVRKAATAIGVSPSMVQKLTRTHDNGGTR